MATCICPATAWKRRSRLDHRHRIRRAAVLVWFALLLTVMLGMIGLLLDAGLLMAAHRQAQNAADAAALAAANDLLHGKWPSQARATAIAFVKEYNGFPDAPDPTVNIPPTQGNYVWGRGYVEVVVTVPTRTFLVQVLPGVDPDQTISAWAVAGVELGLSDEGVPVPQAFLVE